ncbi:hypothetical protein, partial [Mycobacterium szulgai]|uniref:hypothetical protein n=1 Tax=Mycobacterium szulgai TaxID=1787 RepID=UPI001B80AD6E
AALDASPRDDSAEGFTYEFALSRGLAEPAVRVGSAAMASAGRAETAVAPHCCSAPVASAGPAGTAW